MKKKSGFTLIELVVALACISILLVIISTSMVFLTKINNQNQENSKTIYQLGCLQRYIENHNDYTKYVFENNRLIYDKKVIFSENTLSNVESIRFIDNEQKTLTYVVVDYKYNTELKQIKWVIEIK